MSSTIRAGILTVAAVGLVAACATDRLHREGLQAIDDGRYVEGIAMLEQAVQAEPGNIAYLIDLKARRDAAVQQLIAAADSARSAGRLDEASSLYGMVLAIDAGNNRAQRGIDGVAADRRHAELIAQARSDFDRGAIDDADAKVRAVLAENPGFAAANTLRARIDATREPVSVERRLRPRDETPVTLQFRDANTKMVFEVLSRQTGINFVFDRDVPSTGTTTIFVNQVPVEQAIELIIGQNQLARQVLSDNMVLIYPNTPQKRRDYEDQIVKAFYLTNADPAQAQTMLQTVLNTETLYVDARVNSIIIRDTPETIRMAERLLASIDVPEPEVMMEVEVLEITRSRLQQLGINYPTAFSLTQTSPDGAPFTQNDYDRQTGDTIIATPLSISVDLLKQTGYANLLASPRIRARNKESARVLIGSRVPVITNSVTPTSTGAAVVTGSVQYLDVGLTLQVEPTIYLDGDVAINVDLEVSTIVKEVRSGGGSDANQGTLAYEIGTRNASTLLRLKDGETEILAGLIQDRDTQNSSHIPGLGDIPIVGRLFGSQRDTNDKTEVVLSITPRIIRSQPRAASENTEFYYGTESSNRSAPLGAAGAALGGAGAPMGAIGTAPVDGGSPIAGPVGAVVERGSSSGSGSVSGSGSGASNSPVAATNAAPETRTSAPSRPAAPSRPGGARAPTVSWNAPGQVNVGQDFDVAVDFSGGDPMTNVRAQVRYDPAVFVLQSGEAGGAVPILLQGTTVPRVNQIAGVAQFVVEGSPDGLISGEGGLMVLHFRATTPSPGSQISLQLATVNATGTSSAPAMQDPLTIVVMP